jgi:homopolymeric O-antigen transport system ATP-binding protein
MNDDVVVSVKNVSKKFCKNLKRSMAYGISDLSKNLFGIKSNSAELRKDEFWAVNNVNFELKKGETLGIMGANGSGKSTLLRLLTGIFPPDKGEIAIKGQVAALIAIGAGFHPHMTGRENIFLNGTILGYEKIELKQKFDEIVEFSDIGDFLDAPIATYSSGMRVKLGFSIAVHRVPDLLLIDEVLAVGDLNFRLKSYKKLSEVMKQGTTVILVSHNDIAIKSVCEKMAILHRSQIDDIGNTDEMIIKYRSIMMNEIIKDIKIPHSPISPKTAPTLLNKINIINLELRDCHDDLIRHNKKEIKKIKYSEMNSLKLLIDIDVIDEINNPIIDFFIRDMTKAEETYICGAMISKNNYPKFTKLEKGEKRIAIDLDISKLTPNTYYVYFIIGDLDFLNRKYAYIDYTDKITFEIIYSGEYKKHKDNVLTPYFFSTKKFEIQ